VGPQYLDFWQHHPAPQKVQEPEAKLQALDLEHLRLAAPGRVAEPDLMGRDPWR
jgi:hypothetical protein